MGLGNTHYILWSDELKWAPGEKKTDIWVVFFSSDKSVVFLSKNGQKLQKNVRKEKKSDLWYVFFPSTWLENPSGFVDERT